MGVLGKVAASKNFSTLRCCNYIYFYRIAHRILIRSYICLMETDGLFTMESIENLILEKHKTLSKNQKKVADFIINNLNKAAFLSVVEIGEKCGASKATVVRFAQSLGFDGFLDFRNALHRAVQIKYSHIEQFPLLADSDKETIHNIAKQEVKNINQTIDSLNLKSFKSIISLFRKSNTIYTYGQGISALMSQVFAYLLNQVAIKAEPIVGSPLSFEEKVFFIDRSDVLLVMSFPPYSKATIEAVKIAQRRFIPVVAFTDQRTSPVVTMANHSLFIQSENMLFTNSFAAMSMIINAITMELSIYSREKALRFIQETNELINNNE